MQVRNIIISASAAVLLGAMLVLLVKVQESPAGSVPETALAEARQRHERAQSRRAPPAPASEPRSITPRERSPRPAKKPRTRAASEDSPPRPRPSIRGRSLSGVINQSPRDRAESLKERMDAVNSLYDHKDFEAALDAARVILEESPRNVRMLRVVVSSACIMGQPEVALDSYLLLPPAPHQRHMRKRCARYGVDLPPPGAR